MPPCRPLSSAHHSDMHVLHSRAPTFSAVASRPIAAYEPSAFAIPRPLAAQQGASLPLPGRAVVGLSDTPSNIAEPYLAMLQLLLGRGLEQVPVDPSGILQVSMPFCATLPELSVLMKFLQERVLSLPSVKGIHILGTDVNDRSSDLWGMKESFVAQTCPGFRLKFKQSDLSKEALPQAGLTLGVHPEAAHGGVWNEIITNIVRSVAPGGVCVFACFFQQEAEAVVKMCANVGARAEVMDNPYYLTHPMPPLPFSRFIIFVSPGTLAAPARPVPVGIIPSSVTNFTNLPFPQSVMPVATVPVMTAATPVAMQAASSTVYFNSTVPYTPMM